MQLVGNCPSKKVPRNSNMVLHILVYQSVCLCDRRHHIQNTSAHKMSLMTLIKQFPFKVNVMA